MPTRRSTSSGASPVSVRESISVSTPSKELDVSDVFSHVGDGSWGWEEHAPYDRVLVSAGAPDVPHTLKAQPSSDRGRMVIPVGDADLQQLVAVTIIGDAFTSEPLIGCRFVPLVGDQGW